MDIVRELRRLQVLILLLVVIVAADIVVRVALEMTGQSAASKLAATASPQLTNVALFTPTPSPNNLLTATSTPSATAVETPTPAPTASPTFPPAPTAVLSPQSLATATSPPVATATATNTQVPAPTQPPPPPTPTRGPLRITKLGVGLYASGGAYLPDMDRLRPSVILLMDPTIDFAQTVHRLYPKAFIVGRRFLTPQSLDQPELRGRQFADYVAQLAVPLKGTVNAWMSYNEVSGIDATGNNYAAWNAFQVAFAHQLQDTYGIDAVAGNDGQAAVAVGDYAKYFAGAISTSHYFGIHAYAAIGDSSMRTDRSKALVLRYRAIHDTLQQAGLASGPMILTETGLADGWRGITTEDSMGTDFIWLADELDKDPYVRGMAVFGLFPPASPWERYNLANSSLPDRIGAYNTDPPRR